MLLAFFPLPHPIFLHASSSTLLSQHTLSSYLFLSLSLGCRHSLSLSLPFSQLQSNKLKEKGCQLKKRFTNHLNQKHKSEIRKCKGIKLLRLTDSCWLVATITNLKPYDFYMGKSLSSNLALKNQIKKNY